jgi:hypothetical protein
MLFEDFSSGSNTILGNGNVTFIQGMIKPDNNGV